MAKNEKNKLEQTDAEDVQKAPEKNGDLYKGLVGLTLAACKAFEVAAEFLFASSEKDGVATILTDGGKRVRYRKGDEVEPLDYIAVTGINPAAKKRKVIAGKKK